MGSYGSGNWRDKTKTTSDYKQLDIRTLQREDHLKPGRSFGWKWERNNKKIASVNIQTESNQLILSYRYKVGDGEWKNENYPVKIEWTPCNYGGARAWFLCPGRGCGRRVAILYCGGIFACRHCHQLAYACQGESSHDRVLRRADKIRVKLGWKPGILNELGGIPKGMHWYTTYRLVDEYSAIHTAALTRMAEQIGMKI